jgi:hypothetical protein
MTQVSDPVYRLFPKEMAIIGQLLVGYSDIEISLMNCVSVVRDDLNSTLKAMFRIRGETARINVAEALAKQAYINLSLGEEFSSAISAMRHCLKIRNKFSHSLWHAPGNGLCFVSLEELADSKDEIKNLGNLNFFYLDITLLQSQETYFHYTDSLLTFVNLEGRYLAGKLPNRISVKQAQLEPPPLYIQKVEHTPP